MRTLAAVGAAAFLVGVGVRWAEKRLDAALIGHGIMQELAESQLKLVRVLHRLDALSDHQAAWILDIPLDDIPEYLEG